MIRKLSDMCFPIWFHSKDMIIFTVIQTAIVINIDLIPAHNLRQIVFIEVLTLQFQIRSKFSLVL